MFRRLSIIRRTPRNSQKPNADDGNKPPAVTPILNRDDLTFRLNQAKETSKLLVMVFTAAASGPCKLVEPALEEMASKLTTSADFLKIDVDMFEEYARELRVEALPTFVLLRNGKVVSRVVGIKKEDLESIQSAARLDNVICL